MVGSFSPDKFASPLSKSLSNEGMMLISPIEGEQLVLARVREKEIESLRKQLVELKEQLSELQQRSNDLIVTNKVQEELKKQMEADLVQTKQTIALNADKFSGLEVSYRVSEALLIEARAEIASIKSGKIIQFRKINSFILILFCFVFQVKQFSILPWLIVS
jgi:predicted alpha/beta hydrolase family esterase